MNNREFLDASRHWLELFDKRMSYDNVPIHERPLKSAMWFVRDAIADVNTGSKENYLDEEWFCVIVNVIKEWYADRYGSTSCHASRDKLSGIVMLHLTPTIISIPVTTSRVEVEGETAWLTFPDKLQDDEDILELFQSKPNLNYLEPDERKLLLDSIKDVVHWSRSIQLNLHSASGLCEEATAMATSVWMHFEKAISDILTLQQASVAVGCWELHLCIEKAFKVFIYQNNTKKHGHCLDDLYEEAKKFGLVLRPSLLPLLPHWKTAIQYRYGEKYVSIDEAIEIYRVALQVVFEITQGLKKELSVNNASILLKKPRWVGNKAGEARLQPP
ncbi:MAG: hypothetical protein HZB47_15320 [Nitrosomonadales bacterium]|nr:hypothetical protein [Nitrosomonadales bacterium]